ncbi:MAG: hypothetical protein FJ404_16395 [Verrucomicrobia bacterium]|nr:hypothetical protein [Verrucomicrobiota bacterium]
MDFLKKHYEKLILSLVLLGSVGGTAFMYFQMTSVEEKIADTERVVVNPPNAKKYETVDLSTNELAVAKLKNPPRVVLTGTNNLFNSVKWIRKGDGSIIKLSSGNEIGPAAVNVTKVTPLHLIVAFEGVNAAGGTTRYQFGLTREADKSVGKRRKVPVYLTPGGRVEGLLLKEIKGPADNPTEFTLVWTDENREFKVTREAEHKSVTGYMVDLNYPPENINRIAMRKDDKITFGGETYNLVAITDRDVTLSAKSNGKNTTVRFRGALEP